MSKESLNLQETSLWKPYEKVLLRFFIIYFALQIVPLDWKFYAQLFSINWGAFYYGDLFTLSKYTPRILSGADNYLNWVILGLIAAVGTVIWKSVDEKKNKQPDYDQLYYWFRVALRYRLALGVVAYGFLKLFLLQAPFPSISNLNTNYGDFSAWKIFTLSLGAAPVYEIFLGVVEIVAGLLLLYRNTATIGAFIILCFAGNIFLSNLAYEGGESVYSLFLTSIAFFLFLYDAPRLVNLLSQEKPTAPSTFKPVLTEKWQSTARLALKTVFIFLFVGLYGLRAYQGSQANPHNIPTTKGLSEAAGLYNVKDFVINNDTLAYSTTDTVRWKDVVFEKWATISIRSKRNLILDSTNVESVAQNDLDKNYELAGSAGRHYYSYTIDSLNHTLTLTNKNKHYRNEVLVWKYERPDANTIVVSGLNHTNDTVNVRLEKINKKYLLIEGRRKPQKL